MRLVHAQISDPTVGTVLVVGKSPFVISVIPSGPDRGVVCERGQERAKQVGIQL